MSSHSANEGNDDSSIESELSVDEELEEKVAEDIADSFAKGIIESSDLSLDGELADKIASSVVEKMADEFSEIAQKSRPLVDVVEDFREMKLDKVGSESEYDCKIGYITDYVRDEIDAETTDALSSEDVEGYNDWRKYHSLNREKPLEDNTLEDDMYLFRELIRYMAKHNLVPLRFEKVVKIPDVNHKSGEGVDEKKIDPELANAAREYLDKYEYASLEHVTIELLCQSGPRRGGVHGLDVDDFDYNESALKYAHTDETSLKKDEASERGIDLFGEGPEIIQDYIKNKRPDETDESGRDPLLTDGNGRLSKSTIQKYAYKWSRPCAVGLGCPHDRDPENCEAAENNNSAHKCPSSRAPHHFRKGYITDQKNRGVSAEAIEHRCDVSPRVQDLHYDLPDEAEKRERYRDEFKNAEDDPDSGFNHN